MSSLTQAQGSTVVLNVAANATTSVAPCKQISVLPFFVQSKSLNTEKIMIPSSKDSGFRPVRIRVKMRLGVNSVSTKVYVPSKLHFSGCKVPIFRLRSRSMTHTILLPSCWMDLDSTLPSTM